MALPNEAPYLSPEHRAELVEKSGISHEVVDARGYFTVTRPEELLARGFSREQSKLASPDAPALVLPLHTAIPGDSLYTMKPKYPREDGPKYEHPAGKPNRLDIPPACRDEVLGGSGPVIITEGIKKADAAASHGLTCVALTGVWNWMTKTFGDYTAPIPDLAVLKGHTVYLCPDSDAAHNPDVRQAFRRLGLHLEGAYGCDVLTIDLPGKPDGKMGLDDYLLEYESESVWELARRPEDPILAHQDKILDDYRRRAKTAERQLADIRNVLKVPNGRLGASRKLSGIGALLYLEDRRADAGPDGWIRARRHDIAAYTGLGVDTTGDHLGELAAARVFGKRTEDGPYNQNEKRPDTILYLHPDGSFTAGAERLRKAAIVNGKGHGGKREKILCPHCASPECYDERKKVCDVCHTVWDKSRTPLNPPDDGPRQDDVAHEPPVEEARHSQDDAQEEPIEYVRQDDAAYVHPEPPPPGPGIEQLDWDEATGNLIVLPAARPDRVRQDDVAAPVCTGPHGCMQVAYCAGKGRCRWDISPTATGGHRQPTATNAGGGP